MTESTVRWPGASGDRIVSQCRFAVTVAVDTRAVDAIPIAGPAVTIVVGRDVNILGLVDMDRVIADAGTVRSRRIVTLGTVEIIARVGNVGRVVSGGRFGIVAGATIQGCRSPPSHIGVRCIIGLVALLSVAVTIDIATV